MRASLLLAALVPLALVGACKKDAPAPEATEASASAAAGTETKPGLSASEGKLLLPPVAGRPAAAYFTLVNAGDKAVTLAAVSVEGAEKAEMHETVGGKMAPLTSLEVKPGETVTFARGGKHVMVFGLAKTVAAGAAAELTLTFADGDKLSVPLTAESMAAASPAPAAAKAPNEGGGTMSGMDMGHGDPH